MINVNCIQKISSEAMNISQLKASCHLIFQGKKIKTLVEINFRKVITILHSSLSIMFHITNVKHNMSEILFTYRM